MNFRRPAHQIVRQPQRGADMADYTIKRVDEMETIFDGIVHRARASLDATAVGMQVMAFPPGWEGYPNHDHLGDSSDEADLRQEEIYIALEGSATLLLDGEAHELEPGVFARVGAGQKRRIVPGPAGFRMVAVGGRPGEAYSPPAWTELGGPLPTPPA
jgi:mannose-6-phosphate isomerase-like protein (cupin superfamily)